MKTYKYTFIQLICCCLLFTGCDNYLDITPKGTRILTTVTDYDQWLNDETLIMGLAQPTGAFFNYLGDNVDVVSINTPPILSAELVYTWASQFNIDMNAPPLFWSEHYAKINLFNTVLVGIDEATGGTSAQKRSLKAEALLGRSLEYFYLLNEFGKSYDAATAATDLAVPFVTSNDVTQIVPPRITVAALYGQLVDDLNTAIVDLPDDNRANRFRGSKAAAYSVLARVHFYASNYPEAQKNAALALQHGNAVMMDFNEVPPTSNLLGIRQDVIYGRMVIGQSPVSLDFMRSFASNDLRLRKLYYSTDNYSFTTRGATLFYPGAITASLLYVNTGTSVQEMKLILAESAARANDLDLALQQLDDVRENRFPTATYQPFTSSDQEAVIQEILKERSHELPFNGLRWFDMRRLDQDNRMPEVHRYDATGNRIATLTPGSERYTLQIPSQVINFNPGMQQNP